MSQTSERAKSRLNNLAAIEPLLSALRTISMGNWQVALNKLKHIQQYESHYNRILYEILPAIDRNILGGPEPDLVGKVIILVIGTEHGLCGRFNDLLAENAIKWLETQDFPQPDIWVFGTKMASTLKRKGISPDWEQSLPAREVGTYEPVSYTHLTLPTN